jgi:TPP-dependent indolepyruvate ferredoxin oxidoreductase alpha subunit
MANLPPVFIDADVCIRCYTCVEKFACPAIQKAGPGEAPWIHAELCNGNGSCMQVCPVNAFRRRPIGGAQFGKAGSPAQDGEKAQ